MQAFPKDSTNMALGGAGPNHSNINLQQVYGTATEGYNDYASTGAARPRTEARQLENPDFDPRKGIEPVHGSESIGLGSSTFLEGAPASRAAMDRRESENENQIMQNAGGIQRKKSLAQRIRGSRPPPGRVLSPERLEPVRTASRDNSSRAYGKHAYFQDYDDAYDQKGAKIGAVEEREIGVSRGRSASSPKQRTGLERRHTNDRSSGLDEKPGGGFINRMKSLRKPRPERRTSDD